jgi:O-antigen/teichoic acid export membrane protein
MNDRRPERSPNLNPKVLLGRLQQPLFRNSLFLLADSAVTSGLGFLFWIIAARFYSATDVGYGSAAISAMTLLSVLGLAGFNFTIVRFLPTAGKPFEMMNSCLTFSSIFSLALAVIFLAGLNVWSPALSFINKNLIFIAAFVTFTLAYTVTSIIRFICIAVRRADLVLSLNAIMSLLKIPLAVFLVLYFHSFGIAAAWGLGASVAVFIGLFLFLPRAHKGYKPQPLINFKMLGELRRYSAGSYAASLLTSTSTWIMPLLVLNLVGSQQNAYFYVIWMISSLLNAIPVAAANSLFAEGSHFSENLGINVRNTFKFTYCLLLPVVIIVLVLSSPILSLFGTAYAVNGAVLLRVLALASLFAGLNTIYVTTLRINDRIKELCAICAAQTVSFLGGSFLLLPLTGIIGIGYLSLGVQAILSLYVGYRMWRQRAQ